MHRQILIFAIFVLLHSVSNAQTRQWSDATGAFQIEAELVTSRGGKVVLEKPNGKLVVVPIAKLSAADRKFLEQKSKPAAVESAQADNTKPERAPQPNQPGQLRLLTKNGRSLFKRRKF